MKETEKKPASGFRGKVELAKSIVRRVYQGEAKAEEELDRLLKDEEGVRAFFVAWLTDSSLAIQNDSFLSAVQKNFHLCRNTIVKNLAMPSAMVVVHEKNKDKNLARESQNVIDRVLDLIKYLPEKELKEGLNDLKVSVEAGLRDKDPSENSPFGEFLKRWSYDKAQLENIQKSIDKALSD